MTILLTIRQFSEKHIAFTQGGLRALRFNAATNGFSQAFVTVGRKVLVDEDKFFAAIEALNRKGE